MCFLRKWGDLLFMWRPGMDVEPIYISSNSMVFVVYSDLAHMPWLLILTYCPAQYSKKSSFWNMLNIITHSYPGPILGIGDFNSILSQHEKIGGKPFASPSQPSGLQLFMNHNGLADLGYYGPKFTWSNKRHGNMHIHERLDRGIANSMWTLLFPDATILHLPINSSDYAPLLLNTSSPRKSSKPFKFEEFWARDTSSLEVIKQAWDISISGTPAYVLTQKLKNVKKNLKIWNRECFGHIQKMIKQLNN